MSQTQTKSKPGVEWQPTKPALPITKVKVAMPQIKDVVSKAKESVLS